MRDRRTKVNKIGTITGKPKIAISVALLAALDAIAEMNVKAIDKPTLPKNINVKNKPLALTGLPMIKLNAP